jgi:ribosomal protein S13
MYMKFNTFLYDLGISKKNTEDSLVQGRQFSGYNQNYVRQSIPHLNKLQETGIPNVDSVVEAMDTSKPRVGNQVRKNDDLSNLEDRFNKILVQYNESYKLFSESLINTNKTNTDTKNYFGKVVTSDDGNYTYINDYGYTHKYSTDAWSNNNTSCPSNANYITTDLYAKFKVGPEMVNGQPCQIAGTNVQNTETKEYAWVDIKGFKHVYSSDLWETKSSTCNVSVQELSNEDYNSIPSGGNMVSTDSCMQLDIDPALWSQLMYLNEELLSLSQQIGIKLNSLAVEDINLQVALRESQEQLQKTSQTIQIDREKLNTYSDAIVLTSANEDDASITQKMYYIHRMVWFLMLLTILSLTMYAFTTPQSKMDDIIGLIVGLIVFFLFVRWMRQ